MNGMGTHQSSAMLTDEWLTPPKIIQSLGPFDLDPCCPEFMPWKTAERSYNVNDNGLLMPWEGFVWCNPPYGNQTKTWMERIALHNNGIALIFARTETKMFFDFIWNNASSLFFFKGRLSFYRINGSKARSNGGAPSVLVGYGKEADKRLENFSMKGKFIKL